MKSPMGANTPTLKIKHKFSGDFFFWIKIDILNYIFIKLFNITSDRTSKIFFDLSIKDEKILEFLLYVWAEAFEVIISFHPAVKYYCVCQNKNVILGVGVM